MTKKKIKWLAPLTAGAVLLALGISLSPAFNNTNTYANPVLKLSSTENSPQTRTEAYTIEDWIKTAQVGDTTEFEGIKYLYEDGVVKVSNITSPEAITQVILPSSLKKTNSIYLDVDNSALDLSQYINLKKVILQGNISLSNYASYLSKIPNDITLITSGSLEGINAVTNLKDLYICETLCSHTATKENLKDKLNQTNCENIYVASWSTLWITDLSGLTNLKGNTINISTVTDSDIGYKEDFFYPYASFRTTQSPHVAIKTIYPEYEYNTDIKSTSAYTYQVDALYEGVETYVMSAKYSIGKTLENPPKKLVTGTLDNVDMSFLEKNKTMTTIVLTSYKITTLDVTFLEGAYDIYFAPTTIPQAVSTLTSNATYNHNVVFHIPNEYKEKYDIVINDENFKNRISYFNISDINTKYSEVRLYDNEVYKISNTATYTMEELNTNLKALKTKGYSFTTDDFIDTQITDTLEQDKNNTSSGDVITGETAGYKTLGLIYYASDKSKEDILKIAGSYILQQNGERYQDINKYEVKFTLNDENLTITVKVDGTLVSDITGKLIKLDSTEYDEFIYMQSLTSSYGELLIDSDSATSKNVNEIYSYALGKAQEVTSITPTTNTDFKISTPSAADLETTYVQNGNTYKAKAEALSFNLDEVIGTNPNITISSTNQEESDYKVKEISKIYVPASISAHGVPSAINNSIIEYQNKRYEGSPLIHMVSSTNKHNGENYEIAIFGKFPDNSTYRQDIPVEIIENSYNLAFALCSDGTIIVIAPFTRKLDVAKVKSDTTSFITNVLKNTNEITFADFNNEETKSFYGSTVGENNLDIVVSGLSSLEESNPTTPVDLSALKQGYTALNKFVFTSDYSIEDTAKLLAEKSLYYNGLPATTKYNLKVTTSSKWISIEYLNEQNEKILSLQTSYTIVKNSKYSFVSAMSDYYTGIIVTDKQNLEVSAFMNEIMKNVISLEEYDFQSTVNMASEGTTNLTGTMHHINQNYYSYDFTLIVEDTKQAIKDSKLEITKSSLKDEVNNAFKDFKEKFQNNKAFKYSMMALGTILGILLIYGAYLLIRKFIKWLKH